MQSPMESMIRDQIIARGVTNSRVLDVLRQTPRELFIPADLRPLAYADEPLPIGQHQTISQPFMVALMTEALQITATNRVLEIGTGCGYQTAILAQLAERVYTVERLGPLLDSAQLLLQSLRIGNVEYRLGDGTLGWPEAAPFDRMIITAAAPQIPRTLLRCQLANRGIAVLPAGPDHEQVLFQITRFDDELQATPLCDCRFVRLIGEEGWAD